MTETGDYMTTEEEYSEKTLKSDRNLTEGSDEYETALNDFKTHIAKYSNDKLYPNMPDWPVFCFYSMAKRRGESFNWYSLPFDERKRLMAEHGKVGRQWAGKIRQLITGSVGLDDSEWGVTLFANNSYDIKGIVYKMRYDEVSVKYAEFGDFYIGLQLPLDQLFRRVGL
jgi:chlorite dismutase